MAEVVHDFGYNEFVIKYKKHKINNDTFHLLVADNGLYSIPITKKDQFRKVIEKFMRLTKSELYVKVKDFREAHPKYKYLTK